MTACAEAIWVMLPNAAWVSFSGTRGSLAISRRPGVTEAEAISIGKADKLSYGLGWQKTDCMAGLSSLVCS